MAAILVQLPIVVGFDLNHIQHLLFGLAYAKTIACVSQVSFRYDDLVNGEPSTVTLGENYNELQFKRWVVYEYANQLGRFQKASTILTPPDSRHGYGSNGRSGRSSSAPISKRPRSLAR